jgi:lysophospholipase L1-like esterase
MSTVRAKRIVILGDSHVDGSTFGKALERRLTADGAVVQRFGWGGSAARTWLAGKHTLGKQFTLEQVKASGPYDIAIISLGTNDGANAGVGTQDANTLRAEAAKSVGQIQQIASAVGAPVTWWVEPPRMGDRVKHYTNYNIDFVRSAGRQAFGRRSIDSTVVGTPDGDGVHLGGRGGEAWAEVVHQHVLSDTGALMPAWLWVASAAVLGAAVFYRFKVRR